MGRVKSNVLTVAGKCILFLWSGGVVAQDCRWGGRGAEVGGSEGPGPGAQARGEGAGPGLPADMRPKAANVSGKLGGVAGVLHGVISC